MSYYINNTMSMGSDPFALPLSPLFCPETEFESPLRAGME